MYEMLPKTHYERASSYLVENNMFGLIDQAIRQVGPDPTYEQFALVFKDQLDSIQTKREQYLYSNYLNIFFHILHMKTSGEKIYYVTPSLVAKLTCSEANIDSFFLRSPFREIFVQIDPGFFYIRDIDSKRVPVHGFYVHLREDQGKKFLRVMASSLLEPTPEIPFNDSTFYFKMEIGPGSLIEEIKKFQNNIIGQQHIDPQNNLEYMKDFSTFVFNTLLYLTSKNADIVTKEPEKLADKLASLKSTGKKRKLQKRMDKVSSYRVFMVGSNIVFNDLSDIKKYGSIGSWKLNKQIRVSGHFREQWYGSEKDGTRHQELIWIDSFIKGPEIADVMNKKIIVKER